jgi:hypothetical protein
MLIYGHEFTNGVFGVTWVVRILVFYPKWWLAIPSSILSNSLKPKTMKLVFADSPLILQHYGVFFKEQRDWLVRNQDNVNA